MPAVLVIGGVTIDRVASRASIIGCRPFAKDGYPNLKISRVVGKLTSGVDPWDAKAISLTQDGTLLFVGDTNGHLTHYDNSMGWVREWSCDGLAKRAEYIPVTDENTLTDAVRYNLPGDDPDYVASRAGRSMGQIVADVLEMATNSAALSAAGIGGYTSAGTGAAATATLTNGAVTGITIVSGGTGYTAAPTVLFSGGGYATRATGTASVSGGAVTGISITAGGSYYRTPPAVVLSRLPTATLTDLDTLSIIPPTTVVVQGERILQALDGVVRSVHPNHFIQVLPTGILRFFDPRAWPADVTLDLSGADPRVGLPTVTTDWGNCYTRCQVRGHDKVDAVTLALQPWPGSAAADGGLAEDFAHDGLTNAEAKTYYSATDFTYPGQSPGTAIAHAILTSGAVSSIAVDNQGYNYQSTPGVTVSGGGGSGATATATVSGGKVTAVAVGSGGSGYTTIPTVTISGPAVGQTDTGTCTCPNTTTVRVTSNTPSARWSANYWDQTNSGRQATIVLRSESLTGLTQFVQARVVANTALAPGGTSDLTLDVTLTSTAYTSYSLFGLGGGASVVYRRYRVTNATLAKQLANYFPYPFAFRNSDGTAASMTSLPVGTVFYSPAGTAPYRQSGIGISVDPEAGVVYTSKPTCLVFSADGTTLVPINDLRVFLPIHTGGLAVSWPADVAGVPQYSGTAYSALGIQRTKYISVNDWRDYSNSANMLLYAHENHDALCDTVTEGSIPYSGLLSAALLPGHKLNITGSGYVTGLETMATPIISAELEYMDRGGATHYKTTLTFSNRRAPYGGAAFVRPSVQGQPFGAQHVMQMGGPIEGQDAMGNPMAGIAGETMSRMTAATSGGMARMSEMTASGIAAMNAGTNAGISGMNNSANAGISGMVESANAGISNMNELTNQGMSEMNAGPAGPDASAGFGFSSLIPAGPLGRPASDREREQRSKRDFFRKQDQDRLNAVDEQRKARDEAIKKRQRENR